MGFFLFVLPESLGEEKVERIGVLGYLSFERGVLDFEVEGFGGFDLSYVGFKLDGGEVLGYGGVNSAARGEVSSEGELFTFDADVVGLERATGGNEEGNAIFLDLFVCFVGCHD